MSSTGAWLKYTNFDQLVLGLRVQCRVVGALVLRELHTRFGRDNIGYLWIFAEPMLLASVVAAIHNSSKSRAGIAPVALGLTGYCTYILFRSIVSRADSTLRANQPLLYHRTINILDMLVARAVLEYAANLTAFIILYLAAWELGYAELPARPLDLLLGFTLMLWWSFTFSMLICAGTHFSILMERLLHPFVYLLMPLSGAFFVLQWIPEPYRTWLSWFPMVQIFEIIRYGAFFQADERYVNLTYILGSCLFLTYLGLLAIRITRRHVHLS